MPDGAALSAPAPSAPAPSSAAPSAAARSPHADDLPAQSHPPLDPWSIATLDLDAYLSRVGLADLGASEGADDAARVRPPGGHLPGTADDAARDRSSAGRLRPTGGTLAALHAAHLAAFPFENLDIMLGRGVKVDLDSIQAKLVGGRRGGYCFEHGQLLGAVLERLGFGVERLLARVWRPDMVGPRTHLTLRVTAGDQRWLVDAGFGASPAGPVPLDASGPWEISGWTYDIAPGDRPGTRQLRELQAGNWVTLYTVEEACVHPIDIAMSNHFTSTYPDSWFTHVRIVARRDPDAIRSLLGRTYTVTRPGHVKERRDLTDAEWAKSLAADFGLTFSAQDHERLAATAGGI
jgi:N-hydroxyarylamine O-acetyltransferase